MQILRRAVHHQPHLASDLAALQERKAILNVVRMPMQETFVAGSAPEPQLSLSIPTTMDRLEVARFDRLINMEDLSDDA
jgi:hypothetical protein